MYAWFHIYRPVGPQPCPELSLRPDQQRQAREFVVEMRAQKPILIVDAYHDGLGSALCPAAIGFTHHIGPWGDVEPCPVIQLAKESIHDGQSLKETFANSAFLRDFRETAAAYTRGCILLERPDLLRELAERHGARDTHGPRHGVGRAGRDAVPVLAIQSRRRDPGEELGLSPGQAALVPRLRRLRQALPPGELARPAIARSQIIIRRGRSSGWFTAGGLRGPLWGLAESQVLKFCIRPRRARSVERMILHYRRAARRPAPAELARWSA